MGSHYNKAASGREASDGSALVFGTGDGPLEGPAGAACGYPLIRIAVTRTNDSTNPAAVSSNRASAKSCTARLSRRSSLKAMASAATQPPAKPPACAQLLTLGITKP